MGTPISDEEAIEFVERMLSTGSIDVDVEAAEATLGTDTWREFVSDRLMIERGQDMTEAQFAVLNRGRILKFTELPNFNITTARFIVRGRATQQFRDTATGRFISRADVNQALGAFTFTGR